MKITSQEKEAYKIGLELRNKFNSTGDYTSLNTAIRYENDVFEVVHCLTNIEIMFLEAGFLGCEMPYPVTGWRYGNIPVSGSSYNYRDDRPEQGVSLMAVDDGDSTIDKISAMFISNGRNVVRIAGILNTIRKGSDGEPLVWKAEEI